MKLRDVIGIILMVVLSISGIVLSFGISISTVISSNGIKDSMLDVSYTDRTINECRTTLGHYMSLEKAEEIFNAISVKSHIRQITSAFDTNNIEQAANDVKNEMKQAVIASLEDNISSDTKESYAMVVSEAYIKNLFPITEFSILSNIYHMYTSRLVLLLIILGIVSVCIYIYLANGKKTYKWAIIPLYNIVIINILLIIVFGIFNNIFIGNARTTDVVLNMLAKIKSNVIISTIVVFVIAIVSNYIAYFRKRKHSR